MTEAIKIICAAARPQLERGAGTLVGYASVICGAGRAKLCLAREELLDDDATHVEAARIPLAAVRVRADLTFLCRADFASRASNLPEIESREREYFGQLPGWLALAQQLSRHERARFLPAFAYGGGFTDTEGVYNHLLLAGAKIAEHGEGADIAEHASAVESFLRRMGYRLLPERAVSTAARHRWHGYDNCTHTGYCMVCEGGLGYCETCGLTEGSLTIDCPGVPSYGEHGEAVYRGERDFVGGAWVETPSHHSPRWFDSRRAPAAA